MMPAKSNRAPEYPIRLEGKVRVYASYLPIDKVDALSRGRTGATLASEPARSDTATPKQYFVYAWTDKNNGQSAHATGPFDDDGADFGMQMSLQPQVSHQLKVQVSIRTKDQESKNERTFTVGASCSDLHRLLSGEEDTFRMKDAFMEGNYVRMSLRIANARDYRNHPESSRDLSKPLIALGPSALDKIEGCNAVMDRISEDINKNMDLNHMVMAPGVENFRAGLTRSGPPCTPPCTHRLRVSHGASRSGPTRALLALSLMLGTPAYVFLATPIPQPRVRREDVRGPGRPDLEHPAQIDPSERPSGGDPVGESPLCRHARAGGDPAEGAAPGPAPVPPAPEARPLGRDGRVSAEAGRSKLRHPVHTRPADCLRCWLSPVPAGWCVPSGPADSRTGGPAPRPRGWIDPPPPLLVWDPV